MAKTIRRWPGAALAALLLLAETAGAAGGGGTPVPSVRLSDATGSGRTGLMAQAEQPSSETTNAIPTRVAVQASTLKDGLDAISARDAAKALALRNSLAEGSLDRHILTWALVRSGLNGIPSYEIAGAQRELAGWPGLAGLRAASERALYREAPSTRDVLAAFGSSPPETPEGTIVLSRALVANGEKTRAQTYLKRLWTQETLDVATENKILAEFPTLLTVLDHKRRMELLMYRGKQTQATRFADLGKAQSLYRAWVAMTRNAANADQLIAAVDSSWRKDPAYLFVRIERARKKDDYETAATLLASLPRERDALVDPGEWWVEQRIVSRGLLDEGKPRAAYRIAAQHVATDATDVVDAEFHAGWYALRGLKDGATAARHFERILKVSNRPLSVARAYYWLGRAAEAGGPGTASAYYQKAAAHGATFYGQLAAQKLGRATIDVGYPTPTAEDRERFEKREAVRAIDRLESAGHGWRSDSLYRALAEALDSPGELAILSARAEKTRNHALSLQVGKIAFARGIDVPALAFPLGAIPASANIDASGKALAYAIARQESGFNPAAVSRADARGLLQIMPGTARGIAGRHGLAFNAARLTTDPAYNATLGAHYLGEQIETFGGSYILTFVAYNAGPRRVPEWIARYGDPRGQPLDEVVDWIERIPFGETRSYVQRVMENYQIYKARLGQRIDIANDLRVGRAGS
ncbi:lytic transglycosylase [Rhizobium rhizosphaerae]|uniref:Lytic transglycosylase n=1 Tax=Xaviernesmea rhizosphaerae TaxID=1672749 RepID=A0A1Q9AL30_9HYPH|nr:lytic transglycosylase domain-containing protein [Xaviernesmea rhizosphaerae]OLP55982.1 lytic transglycosylase [Xaviernesmea rhizosphaerae]